MRLGDFDALKEQFTEGAYTSKGVREIIDNAPAVYDNPYSDGKEDGYIEGYEEAKRECELQGEFTDLEREVTADAINYLLGAELREENGYTEEVINALKSVLQKIGAEDNHL
jgi:flagellar biosynthesis/type III secretory pathway protein FliH